VAGLRRHLIRRSDHAIVSVDGREVRLTNLRRCSGAVQRTKGDLLRYADVADVLLPSRATAMV
jgi:hypothetical protein